MNDPFDIVAATSWGNTGGALNALQPAPVAQPEAFIKSSPAEALPSLYGNELTKGLRRGLLGAAGTTQAFAAQAVEPFSAQTADRLFAEANKTLDFEEGLRPKVPTWADVHGPSSFFQYGLGKAGEALPSTALSIGAAGLGGAAGFGLRALTGARIPLGFAAGAGSMVPQEGGEAALSLHNDPAAMANTTPWSRFGLSAAKGGINAALEFTPEALALQRAFHAPRIGRGLGRGLAETGLGAAEAATGEAITEGLQEKTGQIFQGIANPQRDTSQDWENIREAALGGAFGGVGMGAVGGGIHALRSNVPEMPNVQMPNMPRLPQNFEEGYDLGHKTAAAVHQAASNIQDWVQNLGRSVVAGVREGTKESREWSDARQADLNNMMTNPDIRQVMRGLDVGQRRAVVSALHSFRAVPQLLETEGGQAVQNEIAQLFPKSGAITNLIQFMMKPGSESVAHLGQPMETQPRDASQFKKYGPDSDEFGTQPEPDESPFGQTGKTLDEILPSDTLGVNKQILSEALQNRAHYFYSGVDEGKTRTDMPLQFKSNTLTPQQIMQALHVRDFATGQKEVRRPFTPEEVAFHAKGDKVGDAAELPINPMSFAAAMSSAYGDQLGNLREGQTGTSGSRKGDIFMSALTTMLNEGVTITDDNGVKHKIDVDVAPEMRVNKPVINPKTGAKVAEQTLNLPDNLLIHRSKQEGDYTVGKYKSDMKGVQNFPTLEELSTERGFIDKMEPHLNDPQAWEAKFKELQKTAPYKSMQARKLYKIYKNPDKLNDFLQQNVRATVDDAMRTVGNDAKETVYNMLNQEGNPTNLIEDLQTYFGSDGETVPASVKKMFKKNNVPLFSKETLTSPAMEDYKGMRPHDYLMKDLEFLHGKAREAQESGLLSKDELAEMFGERQETPNVSGISNTVWDKGAKVQTHEGWKGLFDHPITQGIKNRVLTSLGEHLRRLQVDGKYRVEGANGHRLGYFKTPEEAQQFINDIPAEGYQLKVGNELMSFKQVQEKWPDWSKRFRFEKKALKGGKEQTLEEATGDKVSIINPETGEVVVHDRSLLSNMSMASGIRTLRALHQTLGNKSQTEVVDGTPMASTPETLPVELARLYNEQDVKGKSKADTPLTAEPGTRLAKLMEEKGIKTVGDLRTAYAGKPEPLTVEKLDKLITQLVPEKPGYTREGKTTIRKAKEYDAGTATTPGEGTEPVEPAIRSQKGEELAADAVKAYKQALEDRGITDDFGNRMLPPEPFIAPEYFKKPAEKQEKKQVVGRGESEAVKTRYYENPETSDLSRRELESLVRIKDEQGEAAAKTEYERLKALKKPNVRKGLVTGQKRAEEEDLEEGTPDTVQQYVKRFAREEEKAPAKPVEEGTEHGIKFTTSPSTGYQLRTKTNASADVTIAIAADFTSAGEELTRRMVREQQKIYDPVNYNGEEKASDERIAKTVERINRAPNKEVSLNIAGNGIYTLRKLGDQAKIDAYTKDYLERVLKHPDLEKKITSVRTGGQTGFDEAGAKAARDLGIPTEVHAPKNWAYRVVDGTGHKDIFNDEAGFKARFEKSGVAQPVSPTEKAQNKAKLAFTDKDNKIHLNDANVEADFKSGFQYLFGDAEHGTPDSSAQKRIVMRQLGITREEFSKLVPTVEDYKKFILAHEQSHVDNNDREAYPKKEDGSLDLLNKKAVDIEKRATQDGLKAIEKKPEAAPRAEPMNFRMAAKDNVTGKATTTMQLVMDGVRTATTRHWTHLPKVGDILTFTGRDAQGNFTRTDVRVTGVSQRLGQLLEGKNRNEVLTELSKAEGWTPEAFIRHYEEGTTVNDTSKQVTYELLKKPEAAPGPTQVTGENIASPFRGRNTSALASALTNVTYGKYQIDNVEGLEKPDPEGNHKLSAEAWYKKNATGNLQQNMAMMQKIIEEKLRQYPELVHKIDQKGGAAWIAASEHTVNGNPRWEGKGLESNFIKVLHDAYNAVTKSEAAGREAQQERETRTLAVDPNAFNRTVYYQKKKGLTQEQIDARAGKEAQLVREPDNAHDPNAIKVMVDGVQHGYVPATIAAKLAPIMDAGENPRAYFDANNQLKIDRTGRFKESKQKGPTPGYTPPRSTREAVFKQIEALAEKMFGKKVKVVEGVPEGARPGARGWYEGLRARVTELKANEAELAKVRQQRRIALDNGDQAEVARLEAREASLLKQEEVLGTIYLNPTLAVREMLPTFYHESVHAAFDILLTPAERAILGTAFKHGTVRRQLEKIFKDDPAVLGQMQDAEEAAAYGFQIYSAAPHLIQIGPKVQGMFAKVAKWFKEMLGIMSPEEKANIIMGDMLAGRLADKGLSPLQRVLDKDDTLKQKIAKHTTAARDMMAKLWDVVATPSYDRLIKTNIPSLIEFAKLGHTKTGEKGDLGMIQRQQNKISADFNWIDKLTKKFTEEQLRTIADHRMKGTMPTDPELVRAYKDVDTFFNEFRKYAKEAGVDIGFIKNYWPMLWDAEKVMKERDAFLQMVSKPKYAEHLNKLKVTPTELWENISGYVTRGDSFQGIMGPTGEPVNAYSRERSLSFLDPDERKAFMKDDPIHTMVNYVSHMVRQAEFVRKYGEKGTKKDALLKEAVTKYGATPADIALANDYLDGLLGNKEVGMSRELKDLYGAAVVYQNYRLLPFNLFTSLVDPVGIAIRSGRIGDALEAFTYSAKNIFRDLKKNKPYDQKDQWEKLAIDWGYIEDAGTMANLRHMMETTELRGFSKKMNDALFKWNLLNGWTRSTKIMAVKAGQRFIARAAKATDETSMRHLDELGLKPSDVMETQEGNIALRKDEFMAQGVSEKDAEKMEARMHQAMTKFVNQAILNPVAADLPNWGSNPYLAPIFHLKQFMFAFQTTIISRIIQEAKQGNYKPLWISGIYIPGMIAADALRGFVSNMGDQPPWQKDWGPVDYVKNGVSRSGLLGSGQMIASMWDDVMHGGKGYESAVGPTVEQFMKGLSAAGKGDTALWNFTVKSMPLAPVYDQWLLSNKTGAMGNHFGSTAASATSE